MPFLGPPFEHDVFVSYAHGRGGKLLRWSQRLIEELEGDILDLVTEFDDVDIFIDPDLDPTRPLTQQLRGTVQSSGLLLIIMSEHYLQSDWCQKELSWFESELKGCQASGGLVVVVHVQSTNAESWPDCLKDEDGHTLIGFTFYSRSGNSNKVIHPHGWPLPQPENPNHRHYYEELGKLSTIVTKRLREIKKRPALRASTQPSALMTPANGQTNIYLQAPRSEIDVWRLTKQVMEASGYRVFPEALPDIDGDFKAIQDERKKRLRLLDEEAHALCLLGSREGNGLDREIEAVVNDRTSLQAFGKDIPCALLHRGGGEMRLAEELGLEIIDHDADDWLGHLHTLLRVEVGR